MALQYIVIGGGVGGVTAAVELSACLLDSQTHPFLNKQQQQTLPQVTLISQFGVLKKAIPVLQRNNTPTPTSTTSIEETKEVNVVSISAEQWAIDYPLIKLVVGEAFDLDEKMKTVRVKLPTSTITIPFDKVCIATGATPTIPPVLEPHAMHTLTIRDQTSVEAIQSIFTPGEKKKTIVLVGNGGIAMEVANAIVALGKATEMVEFYWLVRDKYIGHALLDASAAAFVLPDLMSKVRGEGKEEGDCVCVTATPPTPTASTSTSTATSGPALGPNWIELFGGTYSNNNNYNSVIKMRIPTCPCHSGTEKGIFLPGSEKNGAQNEKLKMGKPQNFTILHETAIVTAAETEEGQQLNLELNNGTILADKVIVACGVSSIQNLDKLLREGSEILRSENGIVVNNRLEALGGDSQGSVFAIGDCCDASVFARENELFHQINLWTQSYLAGVLGARMMIGESFAEEKGGQMACGFECFSHRTRLLGKKVVLMGNFNGQGMMGMEKENFTSFVVDLGGRGLLEGGGDNFLKPDLGEEEVEVEGSGKRETSIVGLDENEGVKIEVRVGNEEYVKVITKRGRVVGAMLVGETDLEETLENLMLSKIFVGNLGFDLLDSSIDLEDFFD